ncbi:MAG: LuxR C-terminal-related transcriptional regulator [Actinomycetota bacterium]
MSGSGSGASGAVVVDELPVARAGLAAIVGAAGCGPVHSVGTAREAFELLGADPDLLFVCGATPDRGAEAVVRRLRTLRPTPPAVLLLASGDESVAAYAVAAGFLGVGLRAAEAEEIRALVDAAHRGERRVSPALHGDLTSVRPLAERAEPLLSSREREVLALLAAGHDNRSIAERLGVSPGTVKSHLVRIYAKLGAGDRREAVGRAVELGILG